MPNSALAEIYFIVAMMVLILILSAAAVYLFFRTYKKERSKKGVIQSPKTKTEIDV